MLFPADQRKHATTQLVGHLVLLGEVQLLELLDELVDETDPLAPGTLRLPHSDPALFELPNLKAGLLDHADFHPLQVSPCCNVILLPIADMVKNPVFAIHRVARIGSTQDAVRRAARSGAAAGYCCVAGEQTAGRGRQGRAWQAPSGTALLASVLVQASAAAVTGIPFAAGLAVLDALAEVAPVEAGLKWPNDVTVDGRKLAGLLAEVEPGVSTEAGRLAVVVGLGLNLHVASFPPGAAGVSLHELVPAVPDRDVVLAAWLQALWRRVDALEAAGLPALLEAWRRHAVGLGAQATATRAGDAIDGVVEDIAPDGALLMRTRDGLVRLVAGDVHLGSSVRHG